MVLISISSLELRRRGVGGEMSTIVLYRKWLLILLLLILLLGTVAGLYLVKQRQDQRSKAAESFYDTFFPVGAFEGTGTGNPTQMTSLIDDLNPRDMDSLVIGNGQITASP